ncbi:unnamed protein product [Lathyrus oleraceus]
MVKSISNLYHFFVILVLVAAVWNMELQQVDCEKICVSPMGECGPAGNCAERCRVSYAGGEGSCTLGLCSCTHGCD